MSNVVSKIGNIIGKSINTYHNNILKPRLDDLKFKEEYQGRIIDCMLGEVDDNYITTPETDAPIVKLEYSREGLVKVPTIKGKTILVDVDGNETDTPAEGCKLVSVGESEDNKLIILSKNKNLCDKVVYGDILQTNGGFLKSDAVVRSNHIKVKPDTVYRISETLVASSNWMAIFEYDKNKKFINYHHNKHMRTSSETHYIAFKYHNGENIKSKFQLEEGDYKTSYIEPKQHKTEILLNEPLRSLPNGVCDEIVGNKIIRRIGKKIIDGSERWTMSGQSPSTQSITLPINSSISQNDVIKMITCNNINTSMEHMLYSGLVYGLGYKNSNGVLRIRKEGLEDVESLVKWLSENHITLFYQLEEPIIEELPNGITLEGFDDTTMYIENSITPTVQYGYNALIPYKQELSQQKEEVEINTLDIENNIIPYLMDMEINLMNMEDK